MRTLTIDNIYSPFYRDSWYEHAIQQQQQQ